MKKIIVGTFITLSSITIFAASSDCVELMGQYNCTKGDVRATLEMKLTSDLAISMGLDGDYQEFILDGVKHNSSVDDSTNVATCSKEEGVKVINSFKTKTQTIYVSKTATGVQFNIQMDQGPIAGMACVKIK